MIEYLIMIVKALVIPIGVVSGIPIMVWLERRGSAFIQDRLGPNRIPIFGFRNAGLIQPIADVIKLVLKEDIIPGQVHRSLFLLAPLIALSAAFCTFSVIPLADVLKVDDLIIPLQVADLNFGILFILAIASLGVYGIVLAGWSSNNKYSLLGGLRSSAQLISYEVSMGLAIVGVLMVYPSVRLNDVVRMQGELLWGFLPAWGIVRQPLACLIFLVAMFAETNRTPFDLPEADAEIVAGYHLEYSSMKFAMFFMAEYMSMIVMSGVMVTLFFGGWQIPWAPTEVLHQYLSPIATAVVQFLAFAIKMAFFLFLYVWARWTFPRFRYDQLMSLGWKVLLPLGLVNIFITGLVLVL
ncbi:MAG: NADH-quinone oxidoreductase subunit NuoH [candidate division KSB1 bacterium]|nr:NADH-quinone oxidoreductase subunit NuoH [candidate division KSB1 bacterium]